MSRKPHIIVATMGTKGDFFPYLAVAKEMRFRGYRCTVLSHEQYGPIVEAEGLNFRSIMDQETSNSFLKNPDLWDPNKGLDILFQGILDSTPPLFHEIQKIAESEPCFLVSISGLLGSHIAKKKYDIPMIALQMAPFTHFSIDDPPKDIPMLNFIFSVLGKKGRGALVPWMMKKFNNTLAQANDFILEQGVQTFENFVGEDRYDCDLLVDFWPDWFCAPKVDWPSNSTRVGFLDYEGPAAKTYASDWKFQGNIDSLLGEKPIVFALGSEMRQNLEKVVKVFQETAVILGKKAILVNPTLESAKVESEEFVQIPYAPFNDLFADAEVIVTHGGIGTITRALKLGIPTIITPLAFDQFDNAFQLKRLGISDSLSYKKLEAKALAKKIRDLINQPNLHENLDRVKELCSKNDGEQKACDHIEKVLGERYAEAYIH